MPWNPDKYEEFKSERFSPYFDLASHIKDKPNLKVIDLGCGTGELTKLLTGKLTHPIVLGIDSSSEMLAKAPEQHNLQFKQQTIEDQVNDDSKWDLIFANASLQWIDRHEELFSKIISKLNPAGQLAVQMPCQRENVLNSILLDLVQEGPYAAALNNWKRISPLLSMDEYANLLFEKGGKDLAIYQKVYPIIARSPDSLFEFISGSALIPYLERLTAPLQKELTEEFKRRIKLHFPKLPAIYAFKRLIIYAVF
jgi:trans-aconitate 2-methyltransferase